MQVHLPVLVSRFGANIAYSFVVAVPRPPAHDARPSSNSMKAVWDYEEILKAVKRSSYFRPAIRKMPRDLLAEVGGFSSQRLTQVLLLATRTSSATLVEELLSIGANPFQTISANTEPIDDRILAALKTARIPKSPVQSNTSTPTGIVGQVPGSVLEETSVQDVPVGQSAPSAPSARPVDVSGTNS